MDFLHALLNGIILGGLYGLFAMGFNLQYGVARIMNLAYGEWLMIGAFTTFFGFSLYEINPLLSLAITAPGAFLANWLLYTILMRPLVRRSVRTGSLEADTILATFGLLFVIQNAALLGWGGQLRGYEFLAVSVSLGDLPFAANRVVAFGIAVVLALCGYLFLRYTRTGTAMRAVGLDPAAAQIVGIDVRFYCGLAFASGGALVASTGTLVSTFLSVSPTIGVIYTLKALIVMILGGIGHIAGGLAAGIILGVAENLGAHLIDPGITLAINFALFLLILLIRPQGLFGRSKN